MTEELKRKVSLNDLWRFFEVAYEDGIKLLIVHLAEPLQSDQSVFAIVCDDVNANDVANNTRYKSIQNITQSEAYERYGQTVYELYAQVLSKVKLTPECLSIPARLCRACQTTDTLCFHQDVGGVDYADEYILYCLGCGHIERNLKSGGSPFIENWHTDCPFCGVSSVSHKTTPDALKRCHYLDPKKFEDDAG